RVDLAVVAEEPERLRPFPGWSSVRREALVEDRERDGERGIAQVAVEVAELVGGAKGLVGDGAERERRNVEAAGPLGAASRAEGAQLRLVQPESGGREDELLDPRQRPERLRPERLRLDRHLAPAGRLQTLGAARLLERLPRVLVTQEDHRESAAGGGQQRARKRQ